MSTKDSVLPLVDIYQIHTFRKVHLQSVVRITKIRLNTNMQFFLRSSSTIIQHYYGYINFKGVWLQKLKEKNYTIFRESMQNIRSTYTSPIALNNICSQWWIVLTYCFTFRQCLVNFICIGIHPCPFGGIDIFKVCTSQW